LPDSDEQPVRTFRPFTDDLARLADWFTRCGIKTIAMESTGVYWIAVFEILEQRGFEAMVVNARNAKHVPGRTSSSPARATVGLRSVAARFHLLLHQRVANHT
jgi:transposase